MPLNKEDAKAFVGSLKHFSKQSPEEEEEAGPPRPWLIFKDDL